MRPYIVSAGQVVVLAASLYVLLAVSAQVDELASRVEALGALQGAAAAAPERRLRSGQASSPFAGNGSAPGEPASADLLAELRSINQRLAVVARLPPGDAGCDVTHGSIAAGEVGGRGAPDGTDSAIPAFEAEWNRQQAWTIVDQALANGVWTQSDRDALAPLARQLPAAAFDHLMLRLHDAMNKGELAAGEVDLL